MWSVIVVLGITFLCRTRVGAWCAKYSQYSWVIVPTIHKVGPHGVQNIHITYGLCKIYYGELKAKDSVQNLLWGASTQRGGVQFMGSLFSSLYLAFIWFVWSCWHLVQYLLFKGQKNTGLGTLSALNRHPDQDIRLPAWSFNNRRFPGDDRRRKLNANIWCKYEFLRM